MVMTKVVLDTNVVIEIMRGNSMVIQQIEGFQLFCVPVTVCGELLFGVFNSPKSNTEIQKYHRFMATAEVLEVSIGVVENYAKIRYSLKQKGRPIPENDIWIAAIAMSNDILLLSNDEHFLEIDELNFIHIKK
jgi:tRNA(fMet)-specific endonuclease VapC